MPRDTTAESILIQRLLARDEQALELLYGQYAKNLMAVILRLLRDKALAEEVLQEALLKIWLNIASYDAERGRLFTWMARVCSNHAVDTMRSSRYKFHCRNTSLEVAGAERVPAPASFKPEHVGVRDLILQLKPRQREVIDLLYFEGCTMVEAADVLCVPVATVKTRARTALQVLSKMTR